ncbi:MAG: hypothetical protein QGH41_13285, partial [Roseibacillus sp.]|nr:hypothetical protein [Roseibacillus sp.]
PVDDYLFIRAARRDHAENEEEQKCFDAIGNDFFLHYEAELSGYMGYQAGVESAKLTSLVIGRNFLSGQDS